MPLTSTDGFCFVLGDWRSKAKIPLYFSKQSGKTKLKSNRNVYTKHDFNKIFSIFCDNSEMNYCKDLNF